MRGLRGILLLGWRDRFYTSPLCFATQNIGERPKKQLFLRRGVRKIVVHSSQQREERTKKRCRSYRAFRLVASVVVGVCGTRFAQTVLALFPPSSLCLRRPIKAELTSPFSGFIQLSFFNPSVLRTPPLYFALQNTGEEGEIQYFCSTVVLTPSSCGHSPYIP